MRPITIIGFSVFPFFMFLFPGAQISVSQLGQTHLNY